MSQLQSSVDSIAPDTCRFWLKGSADIASHDDFKRDIAGVASAPFRTVVIDIKDLSFLTSLAVGEMISLNKLKKNAGGKVVIAGPNEYVAGVFKAARLSAVIPIYATMDEAVAACKAN